MKEWYVDALQSLKEKNQVHDEKAVNRSDSSTFNAHSSYKNLIRVKLRLLRLIFSLHRPTDKKRLINDKKMAPKT